MLLRCGHDDDDDEDDEQPNTIAAVVPSFFFFVFLPPATALIPIPLSLSFYYLIHQPYFEYVTLERPYFRSNIFQFRF